MKQAKKLSGLILCVGFLAATLQGSRLPYEPVTAVQQTARAADTAGMRSGSGTDKEEYPPRSEGTFT